MRALHRNKRAIHYALYVGDAPILDEYGNETGESAPIYGEIQTLRCNVSAASGEEIVQAFGSFTNYERAICVADITCPLAEQAVVWFGVGTDKPYNYTVTLRADSKNSILYALREVKVRA